MEGFRDFGQNRTDPWHLRRPSTEDYQWFRNLVDLHMLTAEWLGSLKMEREATPHQLRRVLSPSVQESLWMLEKLTQSSIPNDLESLLDDSKPAEMLSRLEYTVWAVQAWTVMNILDKTPREERSAMRNVLEQSSWKSGRACAKRRWPEFPDGYRSDLRGILAAFRSSPFSGYPRHSTFLVKRATGSELQLELLGCPHQSRYLEVQAVADDLCHLQTHWMRGFAYALNPTVMLDYLPVQRSQFRARSGNRRCLQSWRFHLV